MSLRSAKEHPAAWFVGILLAGFPLWLAAVVPILSEKKLPTIIFEWWGDKAVTFYWIYAALSGGALLWIAIVLFLPDKNPPDEPRIKLDVSDVEARERLKQAEAELSSTKEKLATAEARLASLNPVLQPIASFTVTLKIVVKNIGQGNSQCMDQGGGVAFLCGKTPLIMASGSHTFSRTVSEEMHQYTADLSLHQTDGLVGKSLQELKAADEIVCVMAIMHEDTILGGEVVAVFNGNVRMTFQIPAQATDQSNVRVTGITEKLGVYLGVNQ